MSAPTTLTSEATPVADDSRMYKRTEAYATGLMHVRYGELLMNPSTTLVDLARFMRDYPEIDITIALRPKEEEA